MKYQIGDKVVHPFHGAGIITSIEEKECFGETHLYYLLNLAHSKLELNIPVDSADSIGLRPVMNPEEAEAVFVHLSMPCEINTMNWNKKHRENLDNYVREILWMQPMYTNICVCVKRKEAFPQGRRSF